MSVEPHLAPDLHLLVLQLYGADVNCSIQVVPHHLYQDMCFGSSMIMNKVQYVRMGTPVAAFDPGSTRNGSCNGRARPCCHEQLKDDTTRTVQPQPEC